MELEEWYRLWHKYLYSVFKKKIWSKDTNFILGFSFYAAKLSARRLCQFIPLPPPGQYQYINI